MNGRNLWPVSLLITLLLSLTSCGPRTLSSQDYQELVIGTLQGGELEEELPPFPGLIGSIKAFLDGLYCAESNCVFPSEMNYAAQVAEKKGFDIFEYRTKICNPEKIHPPQDLQSIHQKICDTLDDIYGDIDAIGMTARMAAQLLAQSAGDDATLERVAQNHSARIMEQKEAIIEALRELQGIAWLAPIFEGADSEIPELRIEAEQDTGRLP